MKNAGFAFFLGAIVALPSEVFASLAKLRTFYTQPCAFIASATFRKPAMFAPAI